MRNCDVCLQYKENMLLVRFSLWQTICDFFLGDNLLCPINLLYINVSWYVMRLREMKLTSLLAWIYLKPFKCKLPLLYVWKRYWNHMFFVYFSVYWSCGDKVCYISGAVLLIIPYIMLRKIKGSSHSA